MERRKHAAYATVGQAGRQAGVAEQTKTQSCAAVLQRDAVVDRHNLAQWSTSACHHKEARNEYIVNAAHGEYTHTNVQAQLPSSLALLARAIPLPCMQTEGQLSWSIEV